MMAVIDNICQRSYSQCIPFCADLHLQRCAAAGLCRGRDPGVTLSIGISVDPEDGPVGDQLLQCADTAMYRAKTLGHNNFQFFHTTSEQKPA